MLYQTTTASIGARTFTVFAGETGMRVVDDASEEEWLLLMVPGLDAALLIHVEWESYGTGCIRTVIESVESEDGTETVLDFMLRRIGELDPHEADTLEASEPIPDAAPPEDSDTLTLGDLLGALWGTTEPNNGGQHG